MAIILQIETATPVCSVALAIDGKCVAFKELIKENSHSSLLTVMIDELLQEQGLIPQQLDAIAVSKGPGSYTGLRIGASVAKGLCYAMDKPLIVISTLKAIAWSIRETFGIKNNTLYCPMIDARRMEVYATIVDCDLNAIMEDVAVLLDEQTFSDLLKENTIIFAGDGSEKSKTILTSPNAKFVNTLASARWMCELAEKAFQEKVFADTAYFAPFYLKEFQTTVPRKKL